MPCVNANKSELRAIAGQFPEVIDRIEQWESLVSETSKRQSSTFFPAVNDSTVKSDDDISHETHGIRRIADWANTTRGGRQRDLIATDFDDGAACRSVYGLCE
jgi:hypothetical protein